jgi:hypothetical protein
MIIKRIYRIDVWIRYRVIIEKRIIHTHTYICIYIVEFCAEMHPKHDDSLGTQYEIETMSSDFKMNFTIKMKYPVR